MSKLPVIKPESPQDCEGCGVCCLHMGYPAFVLPREPMTEDQIAKDPKLRLRVGMARQTLLDGTDGETNWQRLPEELRLDLEAFVAAYRAPSEGELDGPCYWYDPNTRQCKHHEYRPNVCRDFQIGSAGCMDWRKVYKAKILGGQESKSNSQIES